MITVPGPAQPAAAGDPAAAAPAVHVEGLRKRYGEVTALAGVDLAVHAGEFFTFLGPSGSGKTTLLRLIAGFERPDGGRIELGGQDVTQIPPYARDVNTVFQDYALFPHMTVAQNIEYGLRVRHVPRTTRRERVTKALDMVRLPGLGSRKPAQLSGGQRQRVALARAIVNEPQVLLLDEPLGALDLKLRQEMQLELLQVQREVGITFVYVTHDQEEALTMSDRIAVLNHGHIEQIGTPVEVYERPRTDFVAGFIGVSNLIERGGHRITVRPEKITMLEDGQQDPPGMHAESGRVQDVIYAGVLTRYVVDLDGGGELVVSRQNVFTVFCYLWLPFMIIPVYAALERIPASQIEASQDLGARTWRTTRLVLFPLALPGIVAGSIFTFSLTLGDYITPLLVGGTSANFMGNIIYSNIGIANNVPFAAAMALVPIAIMAVYLLSARALGAFEAI
jgi:putative spermidine/putrescine transport system ATP-binding protein